MSYLRFTPDEYVTLCSLCPTLAEKNVPTFQQQLVTALADSNPLLAQRIGALGRKKISLLYFHFRTEPVVSREHNLSPEEVQTLQLVCRAAPYPVRFIKILKQLVVGMLAAKLPTLARKVAHLSGSQLEQLYQQALCRRVED